MPARHVAILRARHYIGVGMEGSDVRLQVEMGEESGLVLSPEGRVPGIEAGRDAEANTARCDIRRRQVDEQIRMRVAVRSIATDREDESKCKDLEEPPGQCVGGPVCDRG